MGHKVWWAAGAGAAALLGVALVGGNLAGCSGSGNEAHAQTRVRVETYQIDPASLVLRLDAAPNLSVSSDASLYTMTSRAFVDFAVVGGGPRSLELASGDRVIERPLAGTLTLIRAQ